MTSHRRSGGGIASKLELDGPAQISRTKRFRNEGHSPEFLRVGGSTRLTMGGDDNHRDGRRLRIGFEGREDLPPVHDRERDVQQYQVGLEFLSEGQARTPVNGSDYVDFEVGERDSYYLQHARDVVHDEDALVVGHAPNHRHGVQ